MSNPQNLQRHNPKSTLGRVLITGAGGQLGTEWRSELDRRNLPFEAFGSAELDITDSDQVEELISRVRPDVIINAAAYTKVDLAEQERDKAFSVNADAVGKLAASARSIGALLVHYSTDYVFSGAAQDRVKWPEGYPEEAETHPVNTYGASKLEGEVRLRESGVDWLCLRVSWLCGAHGKNFIKTVRRVASANGEMRVVNDQYGSPTFTPDLVRKSLAMIASGRRGMVHVSSRGETNWHEFACEIVRLSGIRATIHPIPTREYPTPAPRPAFSRMDCSRMEGFGLPAVPWKEGLAEVIRELDSHE